MIPFRAFLAEDKGVKNVPLSSIKKMQTRSMMDRDRVDHYRDKVRRGKKTAPLSVMQHHEKGKYWLLDGHHRLAAHEKEGKKHVSVRVHKFKPKNSKEAYAKRGGRDHEKEMGAEYAGGGDY